MGEFQCEGRLLAEAWGLAVVTGELDIHTSDDLRRLLEQLREQGMQHLIVDLSKVTFVDSAALGLLVAEHRRSGPLHIVVEDSELLKLLRITGLDGIFALHSSRYEALEATTADTQRRRDPDE